MSWQEIADALGVTRQAAHLHKASWSFGYPDAEGRKPVLTAPDGQRDQSRVPLANRQQKNFASNFNVKTFQRPPSNLSNHWAFPR